MKSIEEKAEEYIEPFRASLLSCETDLMKQAYIAGAKEALASVTSSTIQDPQECKHCFMSGEPPFPTCRKFFINSIDADNTCILWRRRDYCPYFTPKTEKKCR